MSDEKQSLAQVIGDSVKAVASEVVDTMAEKVVPQGAAELAQALNSGHGYVPYGSAQAPLQVESEPSYGDGNYDDYLKATTNRGQEQEQGQGKQQEMER